MTAGANRLGSTRQQTAEFHQLHPIYAALVKGNFIEMHCNVSACLLYLSTTFVCLSLSACLHVCLQENALHPCPTVTMGLFVGHGRWNFKVTEFVRLYSL